MSDQTQLPGVATHKQQGDTIIQNIIIRPNIRKTQDIESWRIAMRSAESYNPRRTLLYDLYDDIRLDGHLISVTNKRIMAVTNRRMRYMVNGKPVDAMDAIMKKKEWKKMLREIMLAKFYGITLLEFSIENGRLKVFSIPRKHIRPQTGIITFDQSGESGIHYREPPYANFTLQFGEDNDLGLLLSAAQYVIYKRGGFGDWAQYAEVFGMPFRIGKYDGYDDKTRIELETALEKSGSAAYAVIPKEGNIEFLEQKNSSGSSDLFQGLKDACNKELSVLILGQTETTESSKSSGYAQSQTHAQTEDDINEDDRDDILSHLNDDIHDLLGRFGLPVKPSGEFKYEMPEENISKKDKLGMDLKIAGRQPVADDYFYETYDVPKPDDYDAQKEAQATQQQEAAEAMQKSAKNQLSIEDNQIKRLFHFFVKPR